MINLKKTNNYQTNFFRKPFDKKDIYPFFVDMNAFNSFLEGDIKFKQSFEI